MASTVAAPSGVSVGRPKSKYTRVAALGFLLMAAGLLLWIAAGLIAGQSMGEMGVFFGGGAAVALIGAGTVWRFGTVGKAVGILLAVAPLVMMFWVAFSLGAPGAFAEFTGALMFVVGGLTALGFTIASLVRRRELAAAAAPGETRAMRVIVGIIALGMVASAVMTVTGRTSVEASVAAGATSATMSDFAFSPATYEATAGETTTFVVHNSDAFVHDFAIEALGVDPVMVNPGSEKLVEFTAAEPGEYLIRCTLHSGSNEDPSKAGENRSMSALLVVK